MSFETGFILSIGIIAFGGAGLAALAIWMYKQEIDRR